MNHSNNKNYVITSTASIKHEKKLSGIGDWFTWCQTCLHGGHAGHMMDWFKLVWVFFVCFQLYALKSPKCYAE